jgi:hypothetical protein
VRTHLEFFIRSVAARRRRIPRTFPITSK